MSYLEGVQALCPEAEGRIRFQPRSPAWESVDSGPPAHNPQSAPSSTVIWFAESA